jgi:hypothetical protein
MLPTKKTKPSTDPMTYSILLYGQAKVGKSTFASQAENAVFLATEPGLNALSVFKVDINNWAEMLQACRDLAKGEHEFKTVVIDTIDNAYDYCLEHVCRELKIAHPADADYGKGWAAVNNEFKRVLTKLAALPYGLLLISHSQVQEIKARTGSYDRVIPTLSKGPRHTVIGLVDMVLLCEAESVPGADGEQIERRVIHTKPTPAYDAGDRTGRLPEQLPLDYKAFHKAFTKATGAKK